MLPSHVGRLLVSRPELKDPNFDGTVMLLLQHDETGAFGIVLNRLLDVQVGDVFEDWEPLVGVDMPVYSGGPVEPDALVALGLGENNTGDLVLGLHSVDLAESPVQALASGIVKVRVFAGYAGWGAGQLEGELAGEAWWVLDAEADDVFFDPGGLWARVLRRAGGDMAWFAHMPTDPSLN